MKRALFMTLGMLSSLILGTLALYPVNEWYLKFAGLENAGEDEASHMVDITLYIEWPILILVGAILGHLVYKKCHLRE